jgi:hypothetical protein
MQRFISRCAGALTVTTVAFALTALGGTASASVMPDDPSTDGRTATGTIDQTAAPSNSTTQHSSAEAHSRQRNTNLPISILAFGDRFERTGLESTPTGTDGTDGVAQSNTASNSPSSSNTNATSQRTKQRATQDVTQDVSGDTPAPPVWPLAQEAVIGDGGDGNGDATATGSIDQSAAPSNTTDQQSSADADSKQVNVNAPIAILAYDSNNGDVDQSNTASNSPSSSNTNSTDQTVTQTADQWVDQTVGQSHDDEWGDPGEWMPGCEPTADTEGLTPAGDGGDGNGDATASGSIDQSAAPSNSTDQQSSADASSRQVNVNAPVAILAYDSNNGDVDQSNTASNSPTSSNSNTTTQSVTQHADQSVGQTVADMVSGIGLIG